MQDITKQGSYHLQFSVVLNGRAHKLCKTAFACVVDISVAGLARIIDKSKKGLDGKTNFTINDCSPIEIPSRDQELKKFAATLGLNLTDKQLQLAKIPTRSTKAKSLIDWIDRFVTVAACINPTNGMLQIELCGLEEMYLMYVNDMKHILKEDYLKISQFRKLFFSCFPYVQIRKRKSVTGKCEICSVLSFLRSKCKSHAEIEAVSKLHSLHKIGFMGERMEYYRRRVLGSIENCLSLITDGMAQVD